MFIGLGVEEPIYNIKGTVVGSNPARLVTFGILLVLFISFCDFRA